MQNSLTIAARVTYKGSKDLQYVSQLKMCIPEQVAKQKWVVQGKRRKKTCFLLKVLKHQKLPVQCSIKACTVGYNDFNNLVMQTL
jgi:hypothetical protein